MQVMSIDFPKGVFKRRDRCSKDGVLKVTKIKVCFALTHF